jgi:prolyl oligopeptidase
MPVLLAALLLAAPPPPAAAPVAPLRPVTDVYQGTAVVDPYRWLENGADPEVEGWSKAQDARTRAWLASRPGIGALRERIRSVITTSAVSYGCTRAERELCGVERAGSTYFVLKSQPPRQQPMVVGLSSLGDLSSERVVLDPVKLDPSGGTSVDFFVPSPDGSKLAASISEKGSESGDLRIFDTASGAELPDRIARVNGGTAGGGMAWAADGSGFWYTRYPRPGERPAADEGFFQEVWYHRLGTPVAEDRYELGRELDEPRISEHFLQASADGRVLSAVQKGDGGEYAVWLRAPAGGWRQVARLEDGVVRARFGLDGGLWLLSRHGAPRGKILRVPLDDPDLSKARLVAEAGEGAIEGFEVTADRLWVEEISGGPSRIRLLDLSGKAAGALPSQGVAAVSMLGRTGPREVVYASTSFVAPLVWSSATEDAVVKPLALTVPSPIDFSDVEVVRELATSKDGTKVPMTILFRKGVKRDGRNPALLTGYGGYGLSVAPGFNPARRVLLDQGFVIAVANIRGGGEYGEEWHLAGNLTRKQNVFDDFAACARHLVERRYTSSSRLALQGGSNGGLLMGAMITQHPSLARAVVAQVGLFDMLRVELHPNGAFNVTEFGTVKDPAQWKALWAYSPLHHVLDGTAYPGVLLTAGSRDPRVDAYHARKMTARLQAATSSRNPVLLRVSDFGHGIGTALDERIAEIADVDAFLLDQLGVRYRPPPPLKTPPKR